MRTIACTSPARIIGPDCNDARRDSVRLVAALERALDRIEFFSKYTKNPPEVVYDQWAYERFLRFVHDENKATLAGIRKDLEGRS